MTKIRITILAQKQRSPCTTTISSSLSLSSSLLQLVLRHSWWFSLRMPFPLRVSRSPLVCHCFTVKLLNSFIGVSTLVTFLSERHGCVRGVSFMCRMCLVTFSLLFYRSFELIHRGDRSLSSSFSSAHHHPYCSPLRRRWGFTGVGPAES